MNPQLKYALLGEHAAKPGFSFRQVAQSPAQGVQQLYVDQQLRLFSCGGDASSNNNNGVSNPLVQDLLQRADTVLNELVEPSLQKRKNDLICSGKRERRNVKRKNEFIRFGKRGDDLVRFGRSDSTETEPHGKQAALLPLS
ncbi:unnamed protein product [Haemonchus placei]|uniref:Uncharacterized protein n=1 Tax=Haemonchus placei TaxID=6290 RepID=A0A0N4WZ66_HAEPC|nr:unnamed protein product [Haemonchus placei]